MCMEHYFIIVLFVIKKFSCSIFMHFDKCQNIVRILSVWLKKKNDIYIYCKYILKSQL